MGLEEEEQCLLQAQHQLHVQPLHTQQNFNPKPLLASALSLAHRLTGPGGAHQEEYNDAITSIQSALENMAPRLDEGHSHAQARIQQQLEEIEACHISADHDTVTDSLTDDLAAMTTCVNAQAAAVSAQQAKCEDWNLVGGGLAFPSTCTLSASPSLESKLELAQTLSEWVEEHWSTIHTLSTECHDATTFAADEASRCNPVTAHYDATFCEHRLSCALLTACHRHEVEVYEALIAETEDGMDARKDNYRVIQQVSCIIDLMTDAMTTNATINDSSLGSCGDGADVTHLTLSYPDPVALSECPLAREDDPQCPEVNLPLAWEGGESAIAPNVVRDLPGYTTVVGLGCVRFPDLGGLDCGNYEDCVAVCKPHCDGVSSCAHFDIQNGYGSPTAPTHHCCFWTLADTGRIGGCQWPNGRYPNTVVYTKQ